MSYFARVPVIVNGKGIVQEVIGISQETLDTGHWGDPLEFIQTSYNTHGGVHYGPDRQPDGGLALRANFASVGYTYDSIADVFYAPQPFASWTIGAPTWLWQPPTPRPNDGLAYYWDEQTLSWVLIP